MSTKILTAGVALAVLISLCTTNSAHAEDGHVSANQLAQFGLGQMEVLSDEQSAEVRGSGFYIIIGRGYSGYRYNQFRPVGKVLFHGFHKHHKHGKAGFIHAFAYHYLSHKFAHPGYRFFLPIIGHIHGGPKHR